jgi:hypothetical protein
MSHYRRERNVITEVRNQKTCGACWAFSTAATIEAMYAIKTGMLHKLSVQEVIILLRASLHRHAVISVSGLLYRGVSRSSWTEMMTKCMHTFVFVTFYPVPCFLSLFVVSTVKTDFLDLLIGQSVVAQCPCSSSFIPGCKKNLQGQIKQIRKLGDHNLV